FGKLPLRLLTTDFTDYTDGASLIHVIRVIGGEISNYLLRFSSTAECCHQRPILFLPVRGRGHRLSNRLPQQLATPRSHPGDGHFDSGFAESEVTGSRGVGAASPVAHEKSFQTLKSPFLPG